MEKRISAAARIVRRERVEEVRLRIVNFSEMKRIYFDVMAEFKQHGCKVLLSYNNNSNNNCLLS